MISQILGKTTLPILSRQLDFSSLRNKVIANNIANVNTPDYNSKDVVFDDVLSDTTKRLRMTRTHPDHLPQTQTSKYKVIEDSDKEIKNGINNVDIDKQMVEIGRNQLEFEFSSTMLTRMFNTLKDVIRERVE